jgi:hypothetical protein
MGIDLVLDTDNTDNKDPTDPTDSIPSHCVRIGTYSAFAYYRKCFIQLTRDYYANDVKINQLLTSWLEPQIIEIQSIKITIPYNYQLIQDTCAELLDGSMNFIFMGMIYFLLTKDYEGTWTLEQCFQIHSWINLLFLFIKENMVTDIQKSQYEDWDGLTEKVKEINNLFQKAIVYKKTVSKR